MGLETGTTIASLNAAWPLGTDPRSQGDDHLRLIKAVMKNDALSKAAGGTLSAALTIANVTPALRLLETDAVSPLGQWEFQGFGGGSFGFVRHTVASFGGAVNYFRAFPDNGTLPDRMSFDVAATFNSSVTAGGGATLGGLRVGVDTSGTIRKESADMVLSLSAGGFLFRIGDVTTGPFVARVEAAGTAVPQSYSIVTREKGDARYLTAADPIVTGNILKISASYPEIWFHDTSPSGVAQDLGISGGNSTIRLFTADAAGGITTDMLVLSPGANLATFSLPILSQGVYIGLTPAAGAHTPPIVSAATGEVLYLRGGVAGATSTILTLRDSADDICGVVHGPGTAASNALVVITREKGDNRYALKTTLLAALQALADTATVAQLRDAIVAALNAPIDLSGDTPLEA